jgi:hypothetical protein
LGIRNYLFRFRLFEKFWIRCYSFKMTVPRDIELFLESALKSLLSLWPPMVLYLKVSVYRKS